MDDTNTDSDAAKPVPEAWRPILREIVKAFVEGDFALTRGVPGVRPVSKDSAEQVRQYVEDYGETLVELPEETWRSSFMQKVSSDRWDVLVDLWTAESGRSDMVLDGCFETSDPRPSFTIHMVYVP